MFRNAKSTCIQYTYSCDVKESEKNAIQTVEQIKTWRWGKLTNKERERERDAQTFVQMLKGKKAHTSFYFHFFHITLSDWLNVNVKQETLT